MCGRLQAPLRRQVFSLRPWLEFALAKARVLPCALRRIGLPHTQLAAARGQRKISATSSGGAGARQSTTRSERKPLSQAAAVSRHAEVARNGIVGRLRAEILQGDPACAGELGQPIVIAFHDGRDGSDGCHQALGGLADDLALVFLEGQNALADGHLDLVQDLQIFGLEACAKCPDRRQDARSGTLAVPVLESEQARASRQRSTPVTADTTVAS